jgi:hypothetical protein
MKYLVESDDSRPDTSTYKTQLNKGDIILLSDQLYYCVVAVANLFHQPDPENPHPTLVLSGPALNPKEAMKFAIEHNHLPESYRSYLLTDEEGCAISAH